MSDEYFYGATLSGVNSTVVWNAYGSKDGVDYARPDRLVIKNIMLGPEAKSDEYNVVQASTTSLTKKIKIPIAVLRVGEVRSMRPHLEFTESPVLLKLIHGDGPVHINGIHLIGDGVGEEMEDEMEFEMMAESEEGEDEEIDEEDAVPKKKVKASNNGKQPTNNSKPPKK